MKFNSLFTLLVLNYIFITDIQAQEKVSNTTVKSYAKEVYGTTTAYQSDEHLLEYKNYLNRVEIVTSKNEKVINKTIKSLASVRLKDKYAKLTYDNHLNFNKKKFNALKYAFNFNDTKDQYFQVNGTEYIIIIKANK